MRVNTPFLVAVALATLPLVAFDAAAAAPPPIRGAHGMVVSPEPQATEVGVEVLRRGGNAVDAAVAVAFALSVTYPRAGSLGGGGFLLRRAPGGTVDGLDFRETAPAALSVASFLDAQGRPVAARALSGGLSVGVPGLVAGLAEAHRRWGSRPWGELVAPARELARRGFALSDRTAQTLEDAREELAAHPGAREIFFRDGRPLRAGERLVQRDLAATLEIISREGRWGFYDGPVARGVVAAVRAAGGVMTLADLAAYRAEPRTPIEGRYRGRRIVAFPPPSSGGIVLLQALAMLERFDLTASGPGSSLTTHRIAEVSRRAFADRARWMGDPAFVGVPVTGLLDPAYVAARAASIDDARATSSEALGPGSPPGTEGEQTLHFSIADARGGAVSLTTTLNSWYGSKIAAPGTGIVLNNEMDDFSIAPGVPNQFGLVGWDANAPAPGKRPLSSMSPTIVEAAETGLRPLLVLGSPGGPRIISAVLETIVNVVDHGMSVSAAVAAPRFHHQWRPDRIDHEPGAFPEDVASALRGRGHLLREFVSDGRPAFMGNVAAIALDRVTGVWLGAADPRDETSAGGY